MLVFLTILVSGAFGQGALGSAQGERCGYDQARVVYLSDPVYQQQQALNEQHIQTYAAAKAAGTATFAPVTIPVVVHVLYYGASFLPTTITQQAVQDEIAVLNTDFSAQNPHRTSHVYDTRTANTQIQFCLAKRDPDGNPTTGIVYKQGLENYNASEAMLSGTSGDDAWNPNLYFNIWIVNSIGGDASVVGHTPGALVIPSTGEVFTHGVLLRYDAFAANPGGNFQYNGGRTLTHEVGHYLGLGHIFANELLCEADDAASGDYVADTPPQYAHSVSTATACTTTTTPCAGAPNGDMWMNFMDYTKDDCVSMFTAGQATRMQASLITGGSHFSLTTSQACLPVSAAAICGIPIITSVTNLTSTAATVNWQPIAGATSYTLFYYTQPANTPISVTINPSAGTTIPPTSFTFTGLAPNITMNYLLSATCSNGTSALSISASFTTKSNRVCPQPAGYLYIDGTGASGVRATTLAALGGTTTASIQYSATLGNELKWVVAGKLILDKGLSVQNVPMTILMCENASIEVKTTRVQTTGAFTLRPSQGVIKSADGISKWRTIELIGDGTWNPKIIPAGLLTIQDADIALSVKVLGNATISGNETNTLGQTNNLKFKNNRIGISVESSVANTITGVDFEADNFVAGTTTWPEIGIRSIGLNWLGLNGSSSNAVLNFTKLRYGIVCEGWNTVRAEGKINFINIKPWASPTTTILQPIYNIGIGLYVKHSARFLDANESTRRAKITVSGGYKGIVAENARLTLRNVTVQNYNGERTDYGVSFLSGRSTRDSLLNSTINAGTAVLLNDNIDGIAAVLNNTISNGNGISISNLSVGGNPASYEIVGNTINMPTTSTNLMYGIQVSGVNASAATRSDIRDNHINVFGNKYGFILRNSSYLTIKHNTVQGSPTYTVPAGTPDAATLAPYMAIYAYNTPNTAFSCNYTNNMQAGIGLYATQTGTTLQTNKFGKHKVGLVYGATAVTLPVQAQTSGNLFEGYLTTEVNRTSAWNQTAEQPAIGGNTIPGQLYGQVSFDPNIAYQPNFQRIGIISPSNTAWIAFTNLNPDGCSYLPIAPTDPPTWKSQFKTALGESESQIYADEVKYAAQKAFYKAAEEQADSVAAYADLQALKDSLDATPIADLAGLEEAAKTNYQASNALKLQMEQAQTQLITIEQQIETASANQDSAAVAYWKQQYELTAQTITQLDKQSELLQTVKIENIRYTNHAIDATILQETNQKAVNVIYLRTGAKGNWNIAPQEQTILAYLAAQCPYTGGTAVFEARDMLQTLGIQVEYDDLLLCAQHGIALRQKPKTNIEKAQADFKVYPNPANDYITIEGNTTRFVKITDILGRIIYSEKYEGAKQIINTANFTEGLYTISIEDAMNEIGLIKKIAIIHTH